MINLHKAADAISSADAILITAGAGMGVDSGLPDFRGNQGFWNAYPPMKKAGISFTEMANPSQFSKNPKLAWGFYGHRLNLYRSTRPHDGFFQLLEIGDSKPGKYFVFTSNVDGQFQKAGFHPDKIDECHGSINHFQCVTPCSSKIWPADDMEIIVNESTFQTDSPIPRCKNCPAIARPNILMFGDWNWISQRSEDQSKRLNSWLTDNLRMNRRIVIIEIGAGKAVSTVRFTSEEIAREYDATLIRINLRDFDVPKNHLFLPVSAREGVNSLYKLIKA